MLMQRKDGEKGKYQNHIVALTNEFHWNHLSLSTFTSKLLLFSFACRFWSWSSCCFCSTREKIRFPSWNIIRNYTDVYNYNHFNFNRFFLSFATLNHTTQKCWRWFSSGSPHYMVLIYDFNFVYLNVTSFSHNFI